MNRLRDIVSIICIVVLVFGATVALFSPFYQLASHNVLDQLLPIDVPASRMFSYKDAYEQWQIEPLPRIRSASMIPNSIYINSRPQPNDRLFVITRRHTQSKTISTIKEYYLRSNDGDYLIGTSDEANTIPIRPAILVRPLDRTPHSWQQTDNAQMGKLQGTLTITGDCQVTTITSQLRGDWQESFCNKQLTTQTHQADITIPGMTRVQGIPPSVPLPISRQQFPPISARWQLSRLGKLQPLTIGEGLVGAPQMGVTPDQIVVAMTGGYVMAMDTRDGHEQWRYAVAGEAYSTPTFDPYHGGFVFGTTAHQIVAISETGFLRWEQILTNTAVADPCPTPAGIVFADSGGQISLHDAYDGHEIWHTSVESYVNSRPIYDAHHNQIIVTTQTGLISAFTLTGQLRWQTVTDQTLLADMVSDDDLLYSVAFDGTVLAYRLATGEQQWQLPLLAKGDWPLSVQDAQIAVATNKDVVLIDGRTGTITQRIDGSSNAPPYLTRAGLIITARDDIRLYTTTGTTLAKWDIRELDSKSDRSDNDIDLRTMPILMPTGVFWASKRGQIIGLQAPPQPRTLVQRWHRSSTLPPINGQSFMQSTLDSNNLLLTLHIDRSVSQIEQASGIVSDRQQLPSAESLPLAFAADSTHYYVADNKALSAFDRHGQLQWSLATPQAFLHFVVPYPKMVIHFFQDDLVKGHLRAINPANGTIIWEHTTRGLNYTDDIWLNEQYIVVAGSEAYRTTDGTMQWQRATVLQHLAQRDDEICGIQPSATQSQLECVGLFDGHLKSQTTWPEIITSLKATPNSTLFVATNAQAILGIDQTTSQIKWQLPFTGGFAEPPIVTAQQGYALSNDGRLMEFDVASGTIIGWIRDLPINYQTESNYGMPHRMLLAKNSLYIVSSLHVIAVDIP